MEDKNPNAPFRLGSANVGLKLDKNTTLRRPPWAENARPYLGQVLAAAAGVLLLLILIQSAKGFAGQATSEKVPGGVQGGGV